MTPSEIMLWHLYWWYSGKGWIYKRWFKWFVVGVRVGETRPFHIIILPSRRKVGVPIAMNLTIKFKDIIGFGFGQLI